MIHERGASMIEIIGVLAVAGLMSAAAIGMYNVIRNNQARKSHRANWNNWCGIQNY